MSKITVRRVTLDDAAAIARIYSGPRAIWGTLQVPYYHTEERSRKRIAEADEATFPLVAVVDGEAIGHLLLRANTRPRRKHTGELGMAVRDDWQGRGAGTALMAAAVDLADNWLNLLRLELDVYVDNEPAIRLYKKFGFEIEGTQHGAMFRDGQYVDAYFMARLRKGDWRLATPLSH